MAFAGALLQGWEARANWRRAEHGLLAAAPLAAEHGSRPPGSVSGAHRLRSCGL